MTVRALVLAAVVVWSVLAGSIAFAGGAAASTAGNTTLTDAGNAPVPGEGNVAVVHLDLQSDDTLVNDHDGTTDAQAGDSVGAFSSDAHYYDADGSTDYSTGDEVFLDDDGDGVYTASRDAQVSGLSVGSTVTTTDGFDGDWALDSYDADDTDGGYDASTDAVVIEGGSGGTYSTGADTVINAGENAFVDISAGETLEPMSDISGAETGPHLVDSNDNGEFEHGEDTVDDNDEDDQYTAQADDKIDANAGGGTNDPVLATFDAPAGASLTGGETVSVAAGDDSLSNDNALYYVDSDDSGGYTSSDEVVLEPNAGATTGLTYDADGASDEDGDGSAGDDVLLFKGDDYADDASEGDTLHRFVAADDLAFEDSGHDGTDDSEYQTGEEIYVDHADGGTVSTTADADLNQDDSSDRTAGDTLVPLNGLDSPSNLRWYDEDTNDGYDSDDEIVQDHDGDGLYTAESDTVVVGATPNEGDSLAAGQDADWAIDSHDAVDGDAWEGTTDGLFVDGGDGAYSTDDTLVAGERLAGGTSVTTADAFDSDWSLDSYDADDTDGGYDASEDAVILERGNGEYDDGFDTPLNTGTDGDMDSPDGRAVESMDSLIISDNGDHLVDSNDNGEFDAGEDVVDDLDKDDQYTAQADTGIDKDGASSTSDYGDIEAVRSRSVTGAETVSIPAGGTDAGNELYYVDSDGTPGYSADDELVLDANAESAGSLTLDADPASDEDGDASAGDDTILSTGQDNTNGATEGDTLKRFTASDHVAFEDDGADGTDDGQYQKGEDVLVDYRDGGTVSKGADIVANDGGNGDRSAGDPLIALDEVDSPDGVGWVDEDTNGVYTNDDEIVVDEPDDDTYTDGVDMVVGGTPPTDGTTLPAGENLDGDWAIDAYDDSDGGDWDGTVDGLFVDANGGGTFSNVADTMINAGADGTVDASNGASVSDLDEQTYGYVDTDGDGLDTGDEVYGEGDAASPSSTSVYGDELTALSVEQTGTLATGDIDSVDLYRDDGDDSLDPGADTLVRSGASKTGSTYEFTGLSQSVGTAERSYFVAVDLASDAPDADTLEFDVPASGISFAQDGSTGTLGVSTIEIDEPSPTIMSPDGLTTKTPDQPNAEDDDTLTVGYDYAPVGTDSTTVRLISTDDAGDYYEYTIDDARYDDTTVSKSLTVDIDDDMTAAGGSFSTNPEDLADGEYRVEVVADDDAGASFSTTSAGPLVGIDDTAPTVGTATLRTTGSVDWQGGESVTVDYAFSDDGPGDPDLQVTLSDGNGNGVTRTYTDETTTDGTKTLSQSTTFDTTSGNGIVAGNTYQASVTVTDDYGLSTTTTDTANAVTMADDDGGDDGGNDGGPTGRSNSNSGETGDSTTSDGPTASLTVDDQNTGVRTVTLDSVTLSSGGFVAIHRANASGDILATSEYLEGSTAHTGYNITLSERLRSDTTLVAVAYRDTDDDRALDTDRESVDEAYSDRDGTTSSAVHRVTIAESATTTVHSGSPTTETEPPVSTRTATPGTTVSTTSDIETISREVSTTVPQTDRPKTGETTVGSESGSAMTTPSGATEEKSPPVTGTSSTANPTGQSQSSQPTTEEQSGLAVGGPGFGVVGMVVALLATILGLRRR